MKREIRTAPRNIISCRKGALTDFILTIACIFGIGITLVLFYFFFSHVSKESTTIPGAIVKDIIPSQNLYYFLTFPLKQGMNVADVIAIASAQHKPDFIATSLKEFNTVLPEGSYFITSTNGMDHVLRVDNRPSIAGDRPSIFVRERKNFDTQDILAVQTIPGVISADVITVSTVSYLKPSNGPSNTGDA